MAAAEIGQSQFEKLHDWHQQQVLNSGGKIHRCFTRSSTDKNPDTSHVDYFINGHLYFSRLVDSGPFTPGEKVTA